MEDIHGWVFSLSKLDLLISIMFLTIFTIFLTYGFPVDNIPFHLLKKVEDVEDEAGVVGDGISELAYARGLIHGCVLRTFY